MVSLQNPLFMKRKLLLFIITAVCFSGKPAKKEQAVHFDISGKTENLVIVTIDGLRWKEVFGGADSLLINNREYTEDPEMQTLLYWDAHIEERRKKLMPFFWNVLARKGQLLGNRDYGNKVDVRNPYKISYAGYNELFTGNTDWMIFNNNKKMNSNRNVFERLNAMETYHNRIALFSSWNVFPYILRSGKNSFFMNSAYDQITDTALNDISLVQEGAVFDKENTHTRRDLLTYVSAREYIQKKQPKIVYIAFGETDEYAHRKQYDMYLHHINAFDRMLGELWGFLQSSPVYRNRTSLLVTTDHGRGNRSGNWHTHGMTISGSSNTWMAVMGPNINPAGERRDDHQLYAKELPSIVYHLLGINNTPVPATSNTNDYAGKH